MAQPASYDTVENLLAAREDESVHLECGRETVDRAVRFVHERYARRRCAFYVSTDRGFDRETVRSYLRLFSRLAGGSVTAGDAMAHFGLAPAARTQVRRLTAEQRALLNFARMSLFEPEVVFCERPLADVTPSTRGLVTAWMGQVADAGGILITAGEPLREALLMPGTAFYEEDGRLHEAKTAVGEKDEDVEYAGDEVRVFKVPARVDGATLLFDPREVDFVESVNRANFASVRGELYPVGMTLDELESELERFGFFRCHRSYIVNVQKVAKVERFTRNSFNLTLADAAQTQIPLAKGRAEAMRERYGWR
ncbi:LytTR family transcriptional regulator DNA-binding domain-containing protein [Thermophilibacter provencensis]|uniref:LytTR family transcriptional regulator DNA-binding domain-containing protein n=1 Tax=Thermophilibacter provencensis TaxID=1852386 RepID=A0A921GDD6_9ACTN|nr:LytTR family transcriptional regulator DNA-binding domain-containing protein [Thermophilibacter provencensis]HJF44196.1 LytTR family transcriptional regulator DNA-binding domain-containing protein [Thermophilibacter provencensis]